MKTDKQAFKDWMEVSLYALPASRAEGAQDERTSPAWWIDEEGDILISFPCGKCERMFGDEWGLSSWFSHHLWDAGFEFGGWIENG